MFVGALQVESDIFLLTLEPCVRKQKMVAPRLEERQHYGKTEQGAAVSSLPHMLTHNHMMKQEQLKPSAGGQDDHPASEVLS